MDNKFRYIFYNKDSNEIEKITYISLKEIEQGRLIDDLKKYTIFSRSIFTGQRDQKNQEIYQDDVFDWASHSRGVIKFVNGQWALSNKNGIFSLYGYCSDGVVVGNALLDKDLLNHFDFKTLELEESII